MKKIQVAASDSVNSGEENSDNVEEITTREDGEEDPLLIFLKANPYRRHKASTSKINEDSTRGTNRDEVQLKMWLQNELDKLPGEAMEDRAVTISRVPAWFRKTNENFWAPSVVSIGPYNHGKGSLRGMEEHKLFTLRDFLARLNVGLEVCLQEMRAIEAEARVCYSESVKLNSDDFIKMLLLDGCFILEWLLKGLEIRTDSIYDVGWHNIFSDLYKFENQIPFAVLRRLFFIEDGGNHNCTGHCPLLELIHRRKLYYFKSGISCSNIQHLLQSWYEALVGDFELPEEEDEDDYHEFMLCASELHEAGIKFQRNFTPRNFFDLKFVNGILQIPYLAIGPLEHVNFWNLLAFEQNQKRTFRQILLSYFMFMEKLVKTDKDVALLERCGIVKSYFKTDEDAVAFFNKFEHYYYYYQDYTDIYRC